VLGDRTPEAVAQLGWQFIALAIESHIGFSNSRRIIAGNGSCASGAFMRILQHLRWVLTERARSTQLLAEIRAGSENQQRLLNDKLSEAILALNDISNVLHSKLKVVAEGSDNQQKLLDEKLGRTIDLLSNVTNMLKSRLDAVVGGLDNNSKLLNNKLDAVIAGLNSQTRIINEKLEALIANDARRSSETASKDPIEARRSSR
jgi:hypothetical protein